MGERIFKIGPTSETEAWQGYQTPTVRFERKVPDPDLERVAVFANAEGTKRSRTMTELTPEQAADNMIKSFGRPEQVLKDDLSRKEQTKEKRIDDAGWEAESEIVPTPTVARKLKPFTKEPECEICLSTSVQKKYMLSHTGNFLYCACGSCGYTWKMEVAPPQQSHYPAQEARTEAERERDTSMLLFGDDGPPTRGEMRDRTVRGG